MELAQDGGLTGRVTQLEAVVPGGLVTPDAVDLMPNLFVIGASKAGSSALHAYLKSHPDICMSREKEPCFFIDQTELASAWPIMARQRCSHVWADYLGLWEGGETARYRGEGSVYYSQAPHRSGVPARIAASCPDARIIYSVREPVGRAIAHYWQRFKEFQETLPIEQAMRENAIYRDTSDYALQLRAYLEHFGPHQIKVVVAENLRDKRRETMTEVIEWLGLPAYDYSADQLTERHRSPATSRTQRFPFVTQIRNSGMWAKARRQLPQAWVNRLRAASTTTFDKAEVDVSGARAYLHHYLAPRRAEFESLIGRRVDVWARDDSAG